MTISKIASETDAERIIEIRASGLPDHQDCPRRWAYKMAQDPRSGFLPVFSKHGWSVKPKAKGGIGATIGTACHEAFSNLWQALADGYNLDPEQAGISKFRKLIKDEAPDYDTGRVKTTPDQESAEQQIVRMIRVYEPIAREFDVVETEIRLKTQPDPLKPYLVTGTPDIREKNGNIRDMKFGRNLSPYEAQVGIYRLMARSTGRDVGGLFVDHIKRSSLFKNKKPTEQPEPEIIEYDVKAAEYAAHHEVQYVLEQLEKFIETGNQYAFPARPQSLLCSKKWCPAHGTPFCDLGRSEKSSD